jgi:hypothetical protein
LVRSWKRSGLSASQFAEIEEVSRTRLLWWSSHFRSTRRAATAAAATEKTTAAVAERGPAPVGLVHVVPTQMDPAGAAARVDTPVELVFGDVLVRVRRGFDPVTLGLVIDVLQGQEPRAC